MSRYLRGDLAGLLQIWLYTDIDPTHLGARRPRRATQAGVRPEAARSPAGIRMAHP